MESDSNMSAMMVTKKTVTDTAENASNKEIGIAVEGHQLLEATVSSSCPLDR